MPRKNPVTLCEVEHEEEAGYSQAVSRVGLAIPLLAKLSERVARRDAIAAKLPTNAALFQEPTLFFFDSFGGSALDWLAFDMSKAEGYSCSYFVVEQN